MCEVFLGKYTHKNWMEGVFTGMKPNVNGANICVRNCDVQHLG